MLTGSFGSINIEILERFCQKYRVYLDNLHQELTFYRLVLGLLRLFEASM